VRDQKPSLRSGVRSSLPSSQGWCGTVVSRRGENLKITYFDSVIAVFALLSRTSPTQKWEMSREVTSTNHEQNQISFGKFCLPGCFGYT